MISCTSTDDVDQVGLNGFVDDAAVRIALDDAVRSGQSLFVAQQQQPFFAVLHHRRFTVRFWRYHTVAFPIEEDLKDKTNYNQNQSIVNRNQSKFIEIHHKPIKINKN